MAKIKIHLSSPTETQNMQGEKTIPYAIKIYILNSRLLVPVEFQSPWQI